MSKSGNEVGFLAVIITLILMFVVMSAMNATTNDVWNNGYCADCNQRFVVVKARGSVNYYACPECEQEVRRIIWL